jgi:hypothetical protein
MSKSASCAACHVGTQSDIAGLETELQADTIITRAATRLNVRIVTRSA